MIFANLTILFSITRQKGAMTIEILKMRQFRQPLVTDAFSASLVTIIYSESTK